jgi:hypothetical protein
MITISIESFKVHRTAEDWSGAGCAFADGFFLAGLVCCAATRADSPLAFVESSQIAFLVWLS